MSTYQETAFVSQGALVPGYPYKILTEISPISARISASFWLPRFYLGEISPRFSAKNLPRLARSRRDLAEILPKKQITAAKNLPRFSARSRRDSRQEANLGGQKLAEILGGILPRFLPRNKSQRPKSRRDKANLVRISPRGLAYIPIFQRNSGAFEVTYIKTNTLKYDSTASL